MAEHKHYQARGFSWDQFEAEKKKKAQEEAERKAAAADAAEGPLELTETQIEGLRLLGLDDPAQIDRVIAQSLIVGQGFKAIRQLLALVSQ